MSHDALFPNREWRGGKEEKRFLYARTLFCPSICEQQCALVWRRGATGVGLEKEGKGEGFVVVRASIARGRGRIFGTSAAAAARRNISCGGRLRPRVRLVKRSSSRRGKMPQGEFLHSYPRSTLLFRKFDLGRALKNFKVLFVSRSFLCRGNYVLESLPLLFSVGWQVFILSYLTQLWLLAVYRWIIHGKTAVGSFLLLWNFRMLLGHLVLHPLSLQVLLLLWSNTLAEEVLSFRLRGRTLATVSLS